MMKTSRAMKRLAFAAAAGAAVALAGAAQAQMVTGSAGFNLGYNNSGIAAQTGYNHIPDQENGPVNVQSTDLNAPNLATGAGLQMAPAATSVFAITNGVSGALDNFIGAGGDTTVTVTNLNVDTTQDASGGSSSNTNGKP
ncbi:MAG: hypothetical protein P4M09_16470 [Devosia sp.]|jgi:hypothetical protein|nr:hypothetical protein [Devosia sp.]